jgi:predicted RNA-binding protein (virulence factor B family)
MISAIGQRRKLPVVREAAPGLYLNGGSLGEILLPKRYVPKEGVAPGSELDVFIYRDSEDRLVATTEQPYAQVGEFALLQVIGVKPGVGAFLDWGLSKDLLLPLREQTGRARVRDWVVVAVMLDPRSQRIIASTKLDRYLDQTEPHYEAGQAVQLLLTEQTPLGFKAIIEGAHWGLLYQGTVPAPLAVGQRLRGFIREIRGDGKIDLSLDESGYKRIAPLTEQILDALKSGGGRLELDDSSAPETIREAFGVSKKAFKQALGALFRARRIQFSNGATELVSRSPDGQ